MQIFYCRCSFMSINVLCETIQKLQVGCLFAKSCSIQIPDRKPLSYWFGSEGSLMQYNAHCHNLNIRIQNV